MKMKQLMKYLENLADLKLQESWDNSGFLLGDAQREIEKVFLAVDLTDELLDLAIDKKADLIITHHPLIFKPLRGITADDFIGRRVIKVMSHNINYYVMHTNFDCAVMGKLAGERLGLKQVSVLDPSYQEEYYKIAVYVPRMYADAVRNTMTEEGAGFIGAYSHCTFNIEGKGTFLPLEGTKPFIGKAGRLEKTEEIKIETVAPRHLIKHVLSKMKKVHPYEEPAYDVYRLENSVNEAGAGVVGERKDPISLRDFCDEVKQVFDLETVRVFGNIDADIKTVAVLPGSGKDYIRQAILKGADVYLTGDIGHHDGIDANAQGLSIVDAGHYGLEKIFLTFMEQYLKNLNKELEIITEPMKNPFKIL